MTDEKIWIVTVRGWDDDGPHYCEAPSAEEAARIVPNKLYEDRGLYETVHGARKLPFVTRVALVHDGPVLRND